MKKLTMADIARLADVHKSTVSRYFSGSDEISLETKNKIKAIVQEYGFRPNITARTLAKGEIRNIAVIVPDRTISKQIIGPIFSESIYGIGSVAAEHQFNVTIITSAKEDEDFLHIINNHHAEGFIILVAGMDESFPHMLHKEQIPFMIIGSHKDFPNCVSTDSVHGGYLAVQHLLQLGHRDITIIGGNMNWSHNFNRLAGAKKALLEAGIDFEKQGQLIANVNSMEKGYNAMKQIVESGKLPDAIFCLSDTIAIGVNAAAGDLGIAVPEQLSLVGFGNIMYSQYIRPTLTTIQEETAQLGRLATEALLKEISKNGRPTEPIQIQPHLIVRDSTAPNTR